MCDLAQISWDEYLAIFDRVNLLAEWPGESSTGKGDRFPIREARESVLRLLPDLVGRRVMLLGRHVATAFAMNKTPWMEWKVFKSKSNDELGRIAICVFPRPSGVSRWWNDELNVEQASEFLRLEVALCRRNV